MNLRQAIYSNIFIRNILSSFGGRARQAGRSGAFKPYFRYKIGPYQDDLFLYFSQEPFSLRYKNEIFNKLGEYSGHDIIQYLEFHFCSYSDCNDFLEFLYFELVQRLQERPKNAGLLSALEWVEQKKRQIGAHTTIGGTPDSGQTDLQVVSGIQAEIRGNLNKQIVEFDTRLEESVRQILQEAERSMREIASSFSSGNIELNNRIHEDRLIQLLILIQQIKAPGRPEQLFKKINATDIAAIFHLHFQPFNDNKLNTVQRKITEQAVLIRPAQAKTKRLIDALEDFFY